MLVCLHVPLRPGAKSGPQCNYIWPGIVYGKDLAIEDDRRIL